ncbi:MAG TPA: hypothetical protein VGB76_12915, partial [Pyrinomonadaceae bacterium]
MSILARKASRLFIGSTLILLTLNFAAHAQPPRRERPATNAARRQVAVTFDDLPFTGDGGKT